MTMKLTCRLLWLWLWTLPLLSVAQTTAQQWFDKGKATNDLNEKIACYSEALRLDPKFADAYLQRGVAKNNLGLYKVAVADYNEVLRLKPKWTIGYYNRGSIKEKLGQYQAAITDYDEVIRLNPLLASGYNKRGDVKEKLGRYQAAIADYDEAIRLDAKYAETYLNKGQVLVKLERYAEALESFRQGEALDASITYHQQNKRKAEQWVASHPSNPVATTPASPDPASIPVPVPATTTATPTYAKRYALVVGNGTYPYGNSLGQQPLNDAADMASRLRQLGFVVEHYQDLKQRELNDKVYAFAQKVRQADVALFFYAGHGLMHQGSNYLVPTDAQLTSPERAEDETNSVERILGKLQASGVRFCFVLLDACRNQAFKTWSRDSGGGSRAFAPLSVPSSAQTNTYVLLATQPGAVALNGSGRNGYFTQGLLESLQQGMSIEQVRSKTVRTVLKSTQNLQRPQGVDDMVDEFRF